jgi:hypothetical protein
MAETAARHCGGLPEAIQYLKSGSICLTISHFWIASPAARNDGKEKIMLIF